VDGKDQARATSEQAFAILTARYHDVPELHELILELSHEEALLVIYWMASVVKGIVSGSEIASGSPFGSGIPRFLEILRARCEWL